MLFDRYGEGSLYNWDDIYPLKRCKLLGMNTWCPRNPEPIFDVYYGKGEDRRSPWVCRNGKWFKVSS